MASSTLKSVFDMNIPRELRKALGCLLIIAIALLIARKWVLKWSEKRYCAYGDLKVAGDPIPASKKRKCAVIVGASISGILSGMQLALLKLGREPVGHLSVRA